MDNNHEDLGRKRFDPIMSPSVAQFQESASNPINTDNKNHKIMIHIPNKRKREEMPTSLTLLPRAKKTNCTNASTGNVRRSDKISSAVRGLEHVSGCSRSNCTNPLCVSTRNFMGKVSNHVTTMANNSSHDSKTCSACSFWLSIVQAHSSKCWDQNCVIPLCKSSNVRQVS